MIGRSLTAQLQQLFATMHLGAKAATSTSQLIKSFGWDSQEAFVQNDVHECMAVLFDAMQRESREQGSVRSPLDPEFDLAATVNKMFFGQTERFVRCIVCNTIRIRKESFSSLVLPVRNHADVADSLRAVFAVETLEGSNAYSCEVCNCKQKAEMGTRLAPEGMPPILCCYLNRFEWDYEVMRRKKLNSRLRPLLNLDIGQFVTAEAGPVDPETHTYTLASILMHLGGAGSGHYLSYVRDGPWDKSPTADADGCVDSDAQWLCFNDSSVTRIDPTQLARALGQADCSTAGESAANRGTAGEADVSGAASGAGALPQSHRAPLSQPVSAEGGATAAGTRGIAASSANKQETSMLGKSNLNTSAPTYDAAIGAYMLVYRRSDYFAGQKPEPDTTLLPPDLVARIENDNMCYRNARREYEIEQSKVRLRVYFQRPAASDETAAADESLAEPGTDPDLHCADVLAYQHTPLADLLDMCIAASGLALTDKCIARLRVYSVLKGVPLAPLVPTTPAGATFTQPCTATVAESNLANNRAVFLELRSSASEPWSDWSDAHLMLKLKLWNECTHRYEQDATVVVDPLHNEANDIRKMIVDTIFHRQTSEWSACRRRAHHANATLVVPEQQASPAHNPAVGGATDNDSSCADAPTPHVRLLIVRENSEEPAIVIPELAYLTARDCKTEPFFVTLQQGDTLHVELCDGSSSDDPFSSAGSHTARAWDVSVNSVTVTFTTSPQLAAVVCAGHATSIKIDHRLTLQDLRVAVAAELKVAPNSFRIRPAKGAPQWKENGSTLMYYGLLGGGSIYLETGKPFAPDEYEISLSFFTPAAKSADAVDTVSPLATVKLTADATVASCVAAVIEELQKLESETITDTSTLCTDVTDGAVQSVTSAGLKSFFALALRYGMTPCQVRATRLRLRERVPGSARLTTVYVADTSLKASAANKLHDGKELVLQFTQTDEQFTDTDILVTPCVWDVTTDQITRFDEAAVCKTSSIASTALTLAKHCGLVSSTAGPDATTGVAVCKPWAWQLADVSNMWSNAVKWIEVPSGRPTPGLLDAETESLVCGVLNAAISSEPWRAKAGDNILLTDLEAFVSERRRRQSQVAAVGGAGNSHQGGQADRSTAVFEPSFRILTVEQQLEREAAKLVEDEARRKEAADRRAALESSIAALRQSKAQATKATGAGELDDESTPVVAEATGVVRGAQAHTAAVSAEHAALSAASAAGDLISSDIPALEKYLKLLQIGLPKEAVKQTMKLDGIDDLVINGF
jgi:hypothetical protein